jgi:hypothetical protein
MRAGRVAAALLAALLSAAPPVRAQLWQRTGADGGLSRLTFHATGRNGSETLQGIAAGLEGRMLVGRVWLKALYAQGRLSSDGATAAPRDLVDGTLLVAAQPWSWLTVEAGPRLRAYVAPGVNERWTMWVLDARAPSPVIFGTVRGYAGLWLALASSVNTSQGSGGARGGEIGITFQLPFRRLRGRLAYLVDQAKMKGGTRNEMLESVAFSVGLGIP